ncbi:GIY-YIG nuclease family protein [Fusobacterium mortiferum]|uniref:GIY-YIG nuclease family protein n=1 Tax=Fusobacterium mortiferum TaxID=850 RepID=UPI003F92575B
MGKNFHFQTPFHFLNFCNKYINLEEEDKKVLEYFIDKAIKGDMLCQAIINRFTAILKFEQNNTLDREKIISILSEVYYCDVNLRKTIKKYNLNLNIFGDIKTIFKEEDYSVSEEFIKEMEDLVQVYGLYFLYDQDKNLIYIGKSRNLNERIPSSVKERKAYYLKYKLTKTLTDTHILELYYIAKLKPILNKDSKESDDTTLTIEYSFKKESDFIKIRGDK